MSTGRRATSNSGHPGLDFCSGVLGVGEARVDCKGCLAGRAALAALSLRVLRDERSTRIAGATFKFARASSGGVRGGFGSSRAEQD